MRHPLTVVSAGLVSAVGLSAPQTCAAIRAGIADFAETGYYFESPPFEPIIGARVPVPGNSFDENPEIERLAILAGLALSECLEGLEIDCSRTALLMGVREPYRENADLDGREKQLFHKVEQSLGLRFHSESRLLPEGNASVLRGVRIAEQLLDTNAVTMCIVGGVDSHLNPFDLDRGERTFRILGPVVSRGFVPGEAAGFVAVTRWNSSSSRSALCRLLGIGLEREKADALVTSFGYPTGVGLCRALDAAVKDASIQESRVQFRLSDLNGESYRGVESMLAEARFYRTRRETLPIWHPADCVGETGAAVGAILLIVAAYGLTKGYAPGDLAMCEASSDTGLRAGCVVSTLANAP